MNDERLAEIESICLEMRGEQQAIETSNYIIDLFSETLQALRVERAKSAELQKEIDKITILRPIKNIHEDYGDVLLWNEPIGEPPDVGSCIDCNFDENKYTHFSLLPNIK